MVPEGKKRLELFIDESVLTVLEEMANKKKWSRKKFCENLLTDNAAEYLSNKPKGKKPVTREKAKQN